MESVENMEIKNITEAMEVTVPKKNLNARIEDVKSKLNATARAYKTWQSDIETQANTRNHSKQVFQNTSVSLGTQALDIISILDEMMAQIVKANESARVYHEKYMELKRTTEAADDKLKTASPKTSRVKTAVVEKATQE